MSRSTVSKWLYVGLGVKRWLVLLLFGVVLMGLGLAYVLREVYLTYTFPAWVGDATLQFLPRWVRGVLFMSTASVVAVVAVWQLNRSVIEAVLPAGANGQLVDRIYARRTQDRGPRIVAIGGGTGLSTLLRGLKPYTSNITAIVTVADDGGSSGKLRRDIGVIPPGDIRNCIAALAEAEPLVTDLFQHRFGDDVGAGMDGHSFGNLYLVAMAQVTGNMENAIRETSRVLAVRGRILPASLDDVRLGAELEDGRTVHGESAIPQSGSPVRRVFIEPAHVAVNGEAITAILGADLVVIGPGSLYTSVLPNLLIPGIAEAIQRTSAQRVYVANVATQRGETDDYDAADHYAAIRRHFSGGDLADVVLANSNLPAEPLPDEWESTPVMAPGDADYGGARLVLQDLVEADRRYSHDSERLAAAVVRQYFERDLRLSTEAAAYSG